MDCFTPHRLPRAAWALCLAGAVAVSAGCAPPSNKPLQELAAATAIATLRAQGTAPIVMPPAFPTAEAVIPTTAPATPTVAAPTGPVPGYTPRPTQPNAAIANEVVVTAVAVSAPVAAAPAPGAPPPITPDGPFPDVRRMSPTDALQAVQSGRGIIADVRSAAEYQASHIKGAIRIDAGVATGPVESIARDQLLILYCA